MGLSHPGFWINKDGVNDRYELPFGTGVAPVQLRRRAVGVATPQRQDSCSLVRLGLMELPDESAGTCIKHKWMNTITLCSP